jgi:Ca2+-binding EF-hand superfamily protein
MGIGPSTTSADDLPLLENLTVENRLKLTRHMRKVYADKLKDMLEKQEKGEATQDEPVIVSPTDVDELLYAQMEIEMLVSQFRKLEKEGPLNEMDIDQAVTKIFNQYPSDSNGQMNASTFKTLMVDVMGPQEEAPSEEDVQKLLSYMDKNGNGMIDQKELVGFIIDGCSASPQERKLFAARSPFHEKLTRFLMLVLAAVAKTLGKGTIVGRSLVASISKALERRVEGAVDKLFTKYDVDNSGEIEVGEFHSFMLEVVASTHDADQRKPTARDAERFMGVVDPESKGKSSLSKQSLIDFAVNVMTSSSNERMKFAATSTMHHKLIDFFLSLLLESLDVAEETIKEVPKEVLEARAAGVQNLVKHLWEKYDEDKDDALNAEEFKKMIEGLTQGMLAEQDCQRFLRRMDTSGDGLIQQDEFCEFVEQGLSLSKEDKKKYAARSPMHAMLVSVFVNAERMITENGTNLTQDTLDEKLKSGTSSAVPKSINGLFDRLWDHFDVDQDGALDGVELNQTFLFLTGREIPVNDCERFLQRIDSSGDGKIQKDELVEFVEAGMRLGPEKRKVYRNRSEMHSALLDLFDSVFARLSSNSAAVAIREAARTIPSAPKPDAPKVAEKLSPEAFVAKIWGTFDLDGDGALSAEETTRLLHNFTGHAVTEEICANFLKSIDDDGDAKIQPDELSNFIKNGIKLTAAERKEYSARSDAHGTIIEFFNEVDLRLTGEKTSLPQNREMPKVGTVKETKEEETMINSVVDEIWKRYDKDGTNTINAEEFQQLMSDACETGGDPAAKPTVLESRKFLRFLDEDGNDTLDRHEFHNFILYGTHMSDQQRIDYAERSPMHAKLMIFISVLIGEAKKKQAS